MAKKSSLQKRPEPPNVEEMMEDIQATEGDDILFHVMASYTDEDLSPDSSSLSDGLSGQNSATSSPSDKKLSQPTEISVDTTYLQVQRLIELQDSLVAATQDLQANYKHLQEQGANVSQSLADFREKAESVKN